MPTGINIIAQGDYVASSLKDYLQRHGDLEQRCSKGGVTHYLTTENPDTFREHAQIFLNEPIDVENVTLG